MNEGRKVTNQRQTEVAKKKPSQWYVCLRRRSKITISAYLCCVVRACSVRGKWNETCVLCCVVFVWFQFFYFLTLILVLNQLC